MAIGTLALGQRAALGQSGGAHVHMPELGVAKLPVVPAMDQSLVEPEVRHSVNGVLSTSLRCAYAYRDIGGKRLYLRSYEGGLGPTLRIKPGETLKIRLTNDFPPSRDLVPQDLSRPHQFNNTKIGGGGGAGRPCAQRARPGDHRGSPGLACRPMRPPLGHRPWTVGLGRVAGLL